MRNARTGSIVIRAERCKGCELCVSVCPRGSITMSSGFNAAGRHVAVFDATRQCTACAFCGRICPDLAIEVFV